MGNDDLVSKPQEGQRITATDVLISEGRRYEDDDRWGPPGSDMRIMAALIQRLTARLEEATTVVEITNHTPALFPDYDEYTLDGIAWHRASSNVIRCTRSQARHCAFRRVVRPLHVAREQDGHTPP